MKILFYLIWAGISQSYTSDRIDTTTSNLIYPYLYNINLIRLRTQRIRKALENRTNMEDDRVAILEAQLSQAKLIAEEADKKYEEVDNPKFYSLIKN